MAANDSILLTASEISATNITESSVASLNFTEKLATFPAFIWDNKDYFLLESRIIFTALACIYIGSHAALRRPPSANPPKKSKKGEEQRDRDQEREDQPVQGMLPSDIILFPIMAAVVLVGLYYLIKWLEDPDLLNKILRVYFMTMSLASMGKLFADTLHLLTGFIFPTVWRAKDGKVYHVNYPGVGQWTLAGDNEEKLWDDKKKTPFPGRWSELSLSESKNNLLWDVRHLLVEEWTVRLSVHGIVNEKVKVKFNDILGAVLAIVANIIYYKTESTLLSNIMGYAFSYAGIILMSPTTFATGTGVLFGLFFYDIYMVFFTPYMVTVATQLDVPIKIVFDGGPGKASMLGLGDIVLPGIFVGLCLRFDHYMYYHRQRKLVPVELETKDESSGQLVTNTQTQRMVIKPDYVNPQGQWGDRFWSTRLGNIFSPDSTPALKASSFPKPYFHAAIIGYLLAMIVTLAMLIVYRHAQPALLYLVPGVVFAVWLTGAVRREIREMWAYTEDGQLDTADTIVEVDGDGNVIDIVRKDEKGSKENKEDVKDDDNKKEKTAIKGDLLEDVGSKQDISPASGDIKDASEVKSTLKRETKSYPVFLFSIEAPVSRKLSSVS
ncbi:signal peptide peptidase-domain-containing protein [Annulohypoxylon maeteangense]|uniref:signal peptide peptidase-domain-containing protein n=1 Tax=Annulohypoxylon maeteangense TaxID=1927788 RepID=UPI002008D98D|nr:signal peptide peptidase-domain-containing protein [Annulohypoxylon maeteangense]KAI0886252.1 signal peptide peptidase-domain-containing protein [Annulohypoxylon maeteangense]